MSVLTRLLSLLGRGHRLPHSFPILIPGKLPSVQVCSQVGRESVIPVSLPYQVGHDRERMSTKHLEFHLVPLLFQLFDAACSTNKTKGAAMASSCRRRFDDQ